MRQSSKQLVLDDPLDVLASQPDASSAIDAWLAVFARLMHLPESTRQSIRLELREHLRERVRDLLLSAGVDEREAVRAAIEELGETAELARRFEAANQPNRRRMLMHATLLLAGAGAIIAGVVTFSHNDNNDAANSSVAISRFDVTSEVNQSPPKSLAETKVTFNADTSLRDAIPSIAEQAKVGLIVDWGAMQDNGITTDEPMGISVTETPAGEAITLIAQSVSTRESPLDWGVRNGSVEFGLRHTLDARDIELVTYDVTATINLIGADFAKSKEQASEQVIELITQLVEPENWRENGGDLAQVMLVGGRLFVEAPSRMHTKVKWILDQLPNMPGEKPHVNAGDGVPILQDLPLLGQMFQQPTGDGELESLREAFEAARDDFYLVRQKYLPATAAYAAAEQKVRDAEQQYSYRLAKLGTVRRVLNPGDTLTVSIFALYQADTWASTTRRIDESGMYRVSELGDVRAAGLSAPQFEAEILRQLKSKALIQSDSPRVDVVLETASVR